MSDHVSTLKLVQKSFGTPSIYPSELTVGNINTKRHLRIYAPSANKSKQPPQDVFFRLPRELRDTIYAFVYTPKYEMVIFEFAKARLAPSISLLLVNRRIHREAVAAYEASCATFWANNTFVLPPQLTYSTCGIVAKEIRHMRHVHFHTDKLCIVGREGNVVCSGWIDLTATDGEFPSWTVSEKQADDILHQYADGFKKWLKLMSCLARKSDKGCPMGMKKRRLDEIISALWRLAEAKPGFGDGCIGGMRQ